MRTNRETHPEHRHFMQKSSKNGIVPVIMVVLFVVLLLVCYTWVLQHSYSRNRLDTAVERNIIRMDSINDSLSGVLRDEDFTSIQTIEDMDTEAYIRLQNELDQMRKQNYSYAGVIESLSGAPFDVRFLSFDDIRGNPSVLDNIDVIINVGDGDTAHTGGAEWEDPAVSSAVRKFVYNGGGLIGVGEASGHQYQGHYLQLASVLGVEKETGFTLNYDKYNWEPHPDHFILADCAGDVDFGEGKKNIYALEGTEILIQRDKEVQLAANAFGNGRSVYLSGLPYSFENSRILYRAILWASHGEAFLHKWFSTNCNAEVHAVVKNGKYCVVNNTYVPQDTTVYTASGSFDLHLDANEIRWYSIS